ncbi:hypothetical protein [Actinocrispum wychmicini]|uniref:Uncharacterized protein n=1 Tax=Actinocrispum wychmicini TaxID=1213861 RepID=A0A4R2J7L3_9PSEU|nr:hypothetical protein [Actinocrispum wychmicini]TCO55111.1 hypothetical protein EV192_108399 [Actinocrispum wychmicini]
MNGRAFLEKVAKEQLAGGKGMVNRWEIQGIARGLVAAGVLDQQDADQVMTWLRTKMTEAGMLKVVTLGGQGTVSTSMPVARVPAGAVAERPPLPVLKRVVSLAGRSFTIADKTLHLVSLEVWSTMLVVRTARTYDEDDQPKYLDARLRWRGWDDQGTEYRSNSSTGSLWPQLIVDNRMYEPGPPDDARIFTVVAEHPTAQAVVELPLTSD